MSRLKCSHCDGELGLRERYERLLDLLEASLVVYNANNKFEANPTNQEMAANVMEASVQLHTVIGKYWNDIPGDTIQQKLKNVEDKRIYERDEKGNVIPKEKEVLIQ